MDFLIDFMNSIIRKRGVAVLLFSISLLLMSCERLTTQPRVSPTTIPTSYNLSTDWFFGPAFAPILLAEEKDYFNDSGLSVTILQGNPGGGNMEALAAGGVDFLYGAVDELPYALASGLDIKAVAVFTHSNVNSLVVLKDSGIQGIEDLSGKTVGEPVGGGANYVMFPDVLRSVGVDPAAVNVVAADYPSLGPGLLSRQFDAINVYYTTTPLLESHSNIVFFPYKDYGFDFLGGYGLMVRNEILEDRPDDVRAMVKALLMAWADTARNPEGTINAAAQSEYKESFLEQEALVQYMELELTNLQTPETDLNGLGYSTNEEWQSLLNVLEEYGELTTVLSPDSYYTNEYLPQDPINP